MAIQLNESFIERKLEFDLDPTNTLALERGMCFMRVASAAGAEVVRPSSGVADTGRFAGALWLSETNEAEVPTRESAVVPAAPGPYTVTLRATPLGGAAAMRIVRTDTGAPLATPADFTVTGAVVTFNAALANVPVQMDYRYAITAQELARRGGRRSVNQGAEGMYAKVTLCTGVCRMFVSNFDQAQAYAVDTPIRPGANGLFTSAAGAAALVGRVFAAPAMKSSPGIDQLFLGIEFNQPLAP